MTRRRTLTSSERHGVIALAVVMAIVVALMAIDRGVFSPKLTEIANPDASIEILVDTLVTDVRVSSDSMINGKLHGRKRKHKNERKKSKKERINHPTGRQRNHLDESAE